MSSREYMLKWRAEHKEHTNAYVRARYRRLHPPVVREPAHVRLIAAATVLDGCWLLPTGKARYHGAGGRMSHRVVYEALVGPIPAGLELDHLCHNTRCINPEHLEPVTHLENMRRSLPAQRTHCPQGHAYDSSNTQWYRGSRRCRTCHNRRPQRAAA